MPDQSLSQGAANFWNRPMNGVLNNNIQRGACRSQDPWRPSFPIPLWLPGFAPSLMNAISAKCWWHLPARGAQSTLVK